MLFYDPIPTPCARCGRTSVVAGAVGWVALAIAGGLYAVSLTFDETNRLSTTFRVAAGWSVGPAVLAFLIGMVAAAAGVIRQMNGVRDPGLNLVIAGFLANGLPMVLVGAGAAYDKLAS